MRSFLLKFYFKSQISYCSYLKPEERAFLKLPSATTLTFIQVLGHDYYSSYSQVANFVSRNVEKNSSGLIWILPYSSIIVSYILLALHSFRTEQLLVYSQWLLIVDALAFLKFPRFRTIP